MSELTFLTCSNLQRKVSASKNCSAPAEGMQGLSIHAANHNLIKEGDACRPRLPTFSATAKQRATFGLAYFLCLTSQLPEISSTSPAVSPGLNNNQNYADDKGNTQLQKPHLTTSLMVAASSVVHLIFLLILSR